MLWTKGADHLVAEVSGSATPRTILVIEDSEPIRRILALLLEGHGYHVVTAADSAGGLALARELLPHAVTLDLHLPDADGRAVLHELKADPRTHNIPVMVISAYASTLTPAERSLAADVLSKPFDVDELLSRVSAVVG